MDLKEYIQVAAEMELGGELFVPCDTKNHQRRIKTALTHKAEEYMKFIDPDIKLTVKPRFKDGKFWVVITKEVPDRAIFTKTEIDGVKKVIVDDPTLRRVISLMRRDGVPEDKIRDYVRKYKEADK